MRIEEFQLNELINQSFDAPDPTHKRNDSIGVLMMMIVFKTKIKLINCLKQTTSKLFSQVWSVNVIYLNECVTTDTVLLHSEPTVEILKMFARVDSTRLQNTSE